MPSMIEPPLKEQLYNRLHRSNTIIKACLIAILVINLVTSVFVVFVIQTNQQEMVTRESANHIRTRQHIQCLAEQLVNNKDVPIESYETCANKQR